MRSELVFSSMHFVANRYLLAKLAAKAVRAFHRPNTRIAETVNDVLFRFGSAEPSPRSSLSESSELWLAS